MPLADLHSFFHSVDQFFSNLAAVNWGSLLLALLFFSGYLVLRSRGIFNILQAAYPHERFRWREIWGAYVAAAGFKNVVPAGGAHGIQNFPHNTSINRSGFPPATGPPSVGPRSA